MLLPYSTFGTEIKSERQLVPKSRRKGVDTSTTTYIDRSKHTYLSYVKIAVLKADSTKVAQLSSKNWIVEWDKNIVFNPSTLVGKRVILMKIERKKNLVISVTI